ncbi:VIR protein [Plasmodium vivax]|uniref:VIR protein n=1 Tax=Plasmodium vivax TaxID=5855 RepID=A0A1G4EFU1_PLAVI|nr:VIR protein [Plasmodium vivax]
MDRRFGKYRSSYLNWQKHNDGYCLNKYSAIITEIEEKIDNFNKSHHKNFYQEWKKLNQIIKHRNDDIKDCIAKGHIRNNLYALDTIKRFNIRCPKPNASTCSNNPAPHVRESPSIKVTRFEGSCPKGKDCNKETAAKREEKSKLQSGFSAGEPKRISSPSLHPKDQHEKHPTEKKTIDTRVTSQVQPSNTHIATLVAEAEVSGDKVHLDSITSEQDEARKEHLTVSVSSKVNAEETPPEDHLAQTAINYESATGHSSGVVDSSKNTAQVKLPGNQSFDGNLPGQQHISDHVLPRNDGNDQAVSSNIRDTTFMPAGVSLDKKASDSVHVDASSRGVDSISATSLEQPRKETTLERVSGDVSTINIAGFDINNTSEGNSSNSDTDSVDSPDQTFYTEGSSDKALSSSVPYNAENGSGLVADNGNKSDILGKIFEATSNKDHIIKASAPMGIVMLLGLLFKYTPLWRVLTKNNRKKGAGIIEELNSVVQEPSIMDDERSIPFSYGAFEYSS